MTESAKPTFNHVTDPKLRSILEGEVDDVGYAYLTTMDAFLADLANPSISLDSLDARSQTLTSIRPGFTSRAAIMQGIKEFWLI